MHSLLAVIRGELHKSLHFAYYYRLNTVVRALRFVLQFIGFSLFFGQGVLNPEQLQESFIGYMLWPFIMLLLIDVTWLLSQELQTGSFEQLQMSIFNSRVLLSIRMLAIMVIAVAESMLVAISLALFFRIWPLFSWAAIPVFALILIGLMGFTFFVAGLTLYFKHTEAVTGFILNALSFLNGAILPFVKLPPAFKAVALLLPTTQGILVLRKMLIHNIPVSMLFNDGSFIILIVHTLVMFIGGWFFYRWIESQLKIQGTLGHY